MKRSSYVIRVRKNGSGGCVVGQLGPFPSLRDAKKQAQVLANSGVVAKSNQITVERATAQRRNAGGSEALFKVHHRGAVSAPMSLAAALQEAKLTVYATPRTLERAESDLRAGRNAVWAYGFHEVSIEPVTTAKRTNSRRAAKRTKNPMADGSVGAFLRILTGLVTQQDMRESKRSPNIYRLGHYLGAVNSVAAEFKGKETSTRPADLQALKTSVAFAFTKGFPPVNKLHKAIDDYLATGKPPRYPVTK